MVIRSLFILIAFLATSAATEIQIPKGAEIGEWSSVAFAVWGIAPNQPPDGIRIPSPDGRSLLVVRDWNLTVVRPAQAGTNSSPFYLDGIAEVGWAPDSSAFFITRSDGGWVGG